MIATKIEYHIGKTIFDQPLRLVRERSTGGQLIWVLYRDAANQQDDSSSIAGLTAETIQLMARIVGGEVRDEPD